MLGGGDDQVTESAQGGSGIAAALRALPRLAAPATLDFAAIAGSIDEVALDARLRKDEARFGARLRELVRLAAPASLQWAARSGSSAPRPVLQLLARVAAAAVVAAAACLALVSRATGGAGASGRDGVAGTTRRGLAAESAALSTRSAVPVKVVHVASGPRSPATPPRPRGGP